MERIDPDFLARSRQTFRANRPMSLCDLRSRIAGRNDIAATQRRDMLSALNRLEAMTGRPLATVPALPAAIRDAFAGTSARRLGVSDKTLANIRAVVGRAIREFGDPARPITRRIQPAIEWQRLLDRIETDHVRIGLYRLACFCTAMKIAPEEVSSRILGGLHEALVEVELVKHPRKLIKSTISNWNRCARMIDGWPDIRLSTPFKRTPYTLPLDRFPGSFQRDVQTYVDRVLRPDLLDPEGPDRPLRTTTVDHRIVQIRQFASALVHRDVAGIDEIASLAFLFTPARFKESIRFFLERNAGETTQRLHNQANALRHIARHHCRLDEDLLSELATICKRLDPGVRRQMSGRNRARLRQFDDHANVVRLLRLPDVLLQKARKDANPLCAARRVERAVAIALLIHCGLRIGELRLIEIDSDLSWSQPDRSGVCHLSLPGAKAKTGCDREFELPKDVAALLRTHLSAYRPRLPRADTSWLFPGPAGKPRSRQALREGISGALKKEAGLEMHPHLFRHAVAKIAVEQDPGAYLAVSRVLGHSTLDTTTGYYLGTETKAAARHIDRLLARAMRKRRKG